MKKYFLLYVSLFFLVVKINAAVDPRINWKKISTAHFEIIYDAKQYDLARTYALRAEYVFSVLSPHLSDTPPKTLVIINDSTDLTNGYATRIPYPHIMVYPVLPTSIDSISEYGDWAYELLLHEYVHILSFEPAHGIIAPIRTVFGTIIAPNMLLPRWWLEGIAVEYETRFSQKGRLRSVLQDSALRSVELNNGFDKYEIAEINESDLPSWPRGARPYLFGSLIMSEIVHNKGVETINSLLNKQGSRIPYLIEGPIVTLTDLDYLNWFNKALHSTQIKTQDQLQILRKKTPTQFHPINIKGLENQTPTISPNGQYLALINKNLYGKNSVKIYDRQNQNRPFNFDTDELTEVLQDKEQDKTLQKDAPPGGYINRIAWRPDSSGFAFDKTNAVDSFNNFSDLFIYDFATKKTQNLTKGLRAREPSISPDGLNVAFIHTQGGMTSLGFAPIQKPDENNEFLNNYKIIFTPPIQHRLSHPIFLNNEEILFSWRDSNSNQSFYKISMSHKESNFSELQPSKINLEKFSEIGFAEQTPLGIIFAANENGTSNIYLADNEFKNIQRLTHTETAAYASTIDTRTSNLYTTVITNEGPKIHSTPLQKEALSVSLPNISSLYSDRYPPKNADDHLKNENLEKDFGSLINEPSDYTNWPYILPHYWLPFLYATSEGYGTQISTSSQDPLEFHNYSFQLGYDSFNSQATGAFNYVNKATTWPIVFQSMIAQSQDPILKIKTNQSATKVMITKDLKPWSESFTWAVGISTQKFATSIVRTKTGPELALSYNRLSTSPFSPIPIGGWNTSMAFSHYPKDSSTNYGFDRTIVEGSYYNTHSLPENQVAFLRYKGQYINDRIPVFDFTSSESTPLTNAVLGSGFVLRGYDTSYLVFKSAFNTTFEYGLLLSNKLIGFGTTPAIVKKSRLHFFIDSMVAEGVELDVINEKYNLVKSSKTFLSYGAELKFDSTLGYYFPISWSLGICDRPQYSGQSKPSLFFSIQI